MAGADVVVHLAFIIMAGSGESRHINLTGSRNVFEATVAAKAQRLVYTSSVAAYTPAASFRMVKNIPARMSICSTTAAEVTAMKIVSLSSMIA